MPKRSHFLIFTLSLITAFALGFLLGNFYPNKLFSPPITVTRVLDGDTVELTGGRRVRLDGIDAPELVHNGCLAEEAKTRLEELTLGKKINLKFHQRPKDNFGRDLAVVTVNDQDIGLTLVTEGLAKSLGPYPTEEYKELIFTAEEKAKDEKKGLWQENVCPAPTPVPENCKIKGNIHWKKRQKLYFPPDCTGYTRVIVDERNGDRWFCTAAEAEAADFSLSSTCH